MTTQVKICGITNLEDALDAIELGADFLGFNFYPESKRYITPEDCRRILNEIPYTVVTVGVFVNCDPQLVVDIATDFNLGFLQFHGDEDPDYCNQFGRPFIKALRPKNESVLSEIPLYECDYVLIDSFVQNAYGGTGVTSNWDLARQAKDYRIPLFLSGGLNPENIEMAVQTVKPFAVDVASGVEESPRKKDYYLMQEFIKKAKGIS